MRFKYPLSLQKSFPCRFSLCQPPKNDANLQSGHRTSKHAPGRSSREWHCVRVCAYVCVCVCYQIPVGLAHARLADTCLFAARDRTTRAHLFNPYPMCGICIIICLTCVHCYVLHACLLHGLLTLYHAQLQVLMPWQPYVLLLTVFLQTSCVWRIRVLHVFCKR